MKMSYVEGREFSMQFQKYLLPSVYVVYVNVRKVIKVIYLHILKNVD